MITKEILPWLIRLLRPAQSQTWFFSMILVLNCLDLDVSSPPLSRYSHFLYPFSPYSLFQATKSALIIFKLYFISYKISKIKQWTDCVSRILGIKELSRNYGCGGNFLEPWNITPCGQIPSFLSTQILPLPKFFPISREERLMIWLVHLGGINVTVFVLSMYVTNLALTLSSMTLSGPTAYRQWPCDHFS